MSATITTPIASIAPASPNRRRTQESRNHPGGNQPMAAPSTQVLVSPDQKTEAESTSHLPKTATEWIGWLREMDNQDRKKTRASYDVVQYPKSDTLSIRGHGMRITISISEQETLVSISSAEPLGYNGMAFVLGGALMEMERRAELDRRWEMEHRPKNGAIDDLSLAAVLAGEDRTATAVPQ